MAADKKVCRADHGPCLLIFSGPLLSFPNRARTARHSRYRETGHRKIVGCLRRCELVRDAAECMCFGRLEPLSRGATCTEFTGAISEMLKMRPKFGADYGVKTHPLSDALEHDSGGRDVGHSPPRGQLAKGNFRGFVGEHSASVGVGRRVRLPHIARPADADCVLPRFRWATSVMS